MSISKIYPSQLGSYIVKVKNGSAWHSYDTARLQISVGMPYHEGDKFKATIDWAKYRFKKVVICVNDTLQRYNLMLSPHVSEQEAFFRSMEAGRLWIERNITAIAELPNLGIYRWEEWRQRDEYSQNYDRICNLYAKNETFRLAVETNIDEFWARKLIAGAVSQELFERFQSLSRRYLLEETAVFSMMFEEDYAVDVYPGTPLLPVTIFQGQQIEGAPSGLGKGAFTRIDFNRSKYKNDNQRKAA